MPQHIFYSWQSDTDNRIGRGFIQWALDRAIRAINADAAIDPADRDLKADRDTANVPGMPPLVDTIFDKIDNAVAFVSDLTHVAVRGNEQRSPNPNVLLEHGWALKSRGWRSLIGVMNTAMGHPEEHPLPFDLRHFKRPILFHCAPDATDEIRQAARLGLQRDLEAALRAILDDEVLRAARIAAAPAPEPATAKIDPRWDAARAMLTELASDRIRGGVPRIVMSPALVLRLVPLAAIDRPVLNPRVVMAASTRFPPDMSVRVEAGSDERQWWNHGLPLIPTQNNPETRWLTRFVRPGAIEFEMTIADRIDDDPEIAIDGRGLEDSIVEHLERLANVLASIGLGGAGLIQIVLRGVDDVILRQARPGGRPVRKPELYLPELQVEDLGDRMKGLLREQFNILWHASGWPEGSPSFD
ncbi:hypothetical protein KNJ79_19615 [Sphingopyxis indica]|uniref:hypothetical protein n=1 Tax=Sphingopyxis indica TaxID=436663 RepID=UPI002939288D|nr:hypothetical protein [Sphingopyxis indica]WOF43283.1 hypothetical protein KNJ79_19615 [Sphingopyxis indica]